MTHLLNTEIGGRFRPNLRLGAGTHARVYRAYDAVRKGQVAIKIYNDDALDVITAEAAAQFQVADCPAVLPLYDVLPDLPEFPLTTMPVAAGTLADADVTFASKAVYCTQRTLTALEFCHGRGVEHGDVKPSNVFVDARGAICLGDFGVADFIEGGRRGHTLEYAAPELLQGAPRSPATDVWASAVLLYELLCGELPFGSRAELDEAEVAARICAGAYEQPDRLRPYLPRRFRDVFLRALAPNPDERQLTTASALRNAVADIRLSVEWVQTKAEPWKILWEGHSLDSQGRRTGAIYRAGVRERPKLQHCEAVLSHQPSGGKLRRLHGLRPWSGSEAQARQKVNTWMRQLTAGEDPRG